MVLLKTILIILLVYFGLKVIFRLAAPYLLRYLSKKAEQRFQGYFSGFENQNPQADFKDEEGKVSVDKVPEKRKTSKKTVGEYIEYEEVE